MAAHSKEWKERPLASGPVLYSPVLCALNPPVDTNNRPWLHHSHPPAGIFIVPDHVASAGAIIIDSLEWNAEDYPSLRPSRAYAFIIDQIREKVMTRQSKQAISAK